MSKREKRMLVEVRREEDGKTKNTILLLPPNWDAYYPY